MIAKQLLREDFKTIDTSMSGIEALSIMDDHKVSHLPVVEENVLIGVISEQDVYAMGSAEENLKKSGVKLKNAFVYDTQHFYEVSQVMSEHKLSLVPVISKDRVYRGTILNCDLLDVYSNLNTVTEPGGIIILEVGARDYSLTEIANIVESNDAKIISCFVSSHEDSTKMDVTLKLNKLDLGPVLQTFNRYKYTIKASFQQEDYYDDLKDRYDSLMNYLSI